MGVGKAGEAGGDVLLGTGDAADVIGAEGFEDGHGIKLGYWGFGGLVVEVRA